MKRSGELEKWSRGLAELLSIGKETRGEAVGRSRQQRCLAAATTAQTSTTAHPGLASATKTLVLLFTTFYPHDDYLRPALFSKIAAIPKGLLDSCYGLSHDYMYLLSRCSWCRILSFSRLIYYQVRLSSAAHISCPSVLMTCSFKVCHALKRQKEQIA